MKTKSKSVRILNMLARRKNGMRFTEIQRALWEMTHPKGTFTKDVRGYWCTNLCGGYFYHAGLLYVFATKVNGRWVRNGLAHKGTPWKVLRSQPNTHHSYWPGA